MGGVLGIHHVTAIAGDPQRNLDFYAGTLGLRFVKRTVNFDDPRTYHFYFGDEHGSPGSLLTFFPSRGARHGRAGAGQVAVTSFAVAPGAFGFWLPRFVRHGVAFEAPVTRWRGTESEEQVLAFKDPDGLLLELVASPGAAARPAWAGADGIAAAHALRGLHAVTLWESAPEASERLLVDTLGFRAVREEGATRRFAAGEGGPGFLADVRDVGGFLRGMGGVGTVHHVAWRVADDAAELALRDEVVAAGHHATPVKDRKYFRSVYFREPGGVLFELATDAPGFTVDEPLETLGERLMLPSPFEADRASLEAALPPIHLPAPWSEEALGGERAGGAGAGPAREGPGEGGATPV